MSVELIAITKPVGKLSHISPYEFISYIARVSNPDNQENFDTADKLIRYLIKKSHWSPFEHVFMTFELETTRDIGRQILRHKSLCFQEFSGRYAEYKEDFVVRECRLQDTKNRQNSITPEPDNPLIFDWISAQYKVSALVGELYHTLVGRGLAKEQARTILPEGMTPTTMYFTGSVRSMFHFCLVRCHPGTQKEHRLIAEEVWSNLSEQFPFFKNIDMTRLAKRYQEMFEEILNECIIKR